MKKIFILFTVLLPISLLAQSTGELQKYQRNSLAQMMIYHSEDEFGKDIYEAFTKIPVSDKYDDHNIGFLVIENDSISGVKRKENGLKKAEYGKTLTAGDVKKNAAALEKVLNKEQCATFMVAKWFGMDLGADDFDPTTAHFSMDLIKQRGQYNASDIDVALASQTARGIAALSDAGEELIANTYMLINDMTYVTAEERAAAAKVALNIIGGIFDAFTGGSLGKDVAEVSGDIADSFTGFTVKTHSYLYQLQWNDSVAAIFYNNYYYEEPNIDKLMAFLSDTSTFKMKYVAHEYEFDGKSTLVGKYERPELVKMVCTRSMDKNIAALQLAYEDFKVKTPVYEILTDAKGKTVGYTAKIGMKEGITEKSKFQVIQKIVDPQTNKTKYKYIASLKVKKGQLWDNRYNAVLESAEGSDLQATTFVKTGGGEILPGMLIIEGHYHKVTE